MSWTLAILGSFVVGSIPFSYLLVRLRTGRDLRSIGSGNPGATNALRAAGPAVAFSALVLDIAKGFAPVWLARTVGASDVLLASIAVGCVLGHVLSPVLGFRGGKGVATASGALGALNPLGLLAAAAIFGVTLAVRRIVSLASIVAVGALPLLWQLPAQLGHPPSAGSSGWLASVIVCTMVLLRHGSNLQRLRAGTEWRLGGKLR